MFLRKTPRKKDGKTHDYWSVVENKRVAGGRVVQRHVLYLGEINSSQAAEWRRAIGSRCGHWTPADNGAVPRGSLCRRRVRHIGRSASPVGHAALSAAAVGRLLAGGAVVAGVAAGHLLGRSPAAEPQRHAMGPGPAGIGLVPADRAGQRVEAAPRLVRQERHGRPAGGGLWTGGVAQAVRLP